MTGLANGDGTVVELADDAQLRALGIPAGEYGTADDGNPFGRIFTRYEEGKVFEGPDPTEADFDTMLRRDGKARSVEQVLTLPLRWATLTVEPQDGDSGEAELVREALTRPANAAGMSTPLELVVAQMASAVMFRKAFFEKVWKIEGGRAVYDKLAFRPARTCTLVRDAKTRAFVGFRQKVRQGDGTTKDTPIIKPEKAFVYIHGQHRNPLQGTSDMETVWSCFEAKQKVRFLWFQFLERNVIPHGVLKTKQGDRAARVREVAKLKSGGLVGIDPEESLEPFESAGSADSAFKDAMDWLSAEMSQSVLASFTDLAQQGSGRGSYALSRDQSDLFLGSRTAVLGEMAASLTAWVAADLVRWNLGPDARAPQIRLTLNRDDQQLVKDLFERLASGPPAPQVPQEFTDMLVEKVAGYTGMDVDRVRKAIEARGEQTQAAGGPLVQGIGAAAQLLQEAGVGQNGGAVAPTV